MTKSELQTLIDTNLASGQPVTAVLHRDMLKDNANNLLDNMYGDEVNDSDLTANLFLLDDPNDAEFLFNVLKQGRKVMVSGTITSNVTSLIQVGQFLGTELQCPSGGNYFAMGKIESNTDPKGVNIFNNGSETRLRIKGGIPNGETLRFQITYFTAS